MNLYTYIQQSVRDSYDFFLDYTKKPYVKEVLMLATLGLCLGLSHFGYRWYMKQQDMKAFSALVEVARSYETAVQKSRSAHNESEENPWEDTEVLLQAFIDAHAGSNLAPYFTMYQAQLALDKDNDYQTACDCMEKGLKKLSKSSVFYDMFSLKYTKMLLDHPDNAVVKKALQDLENIAQDRSNYCSSEALYLLGAYYQFHGDMDKAVNFLKILAEEYSEQAIVVSPWAQLAQEKLKTLLPAL